jgi:drug/metabolite transporter (DMT)-like permease
MKRAFSMGQTMASAARLVFSAEVLGDNHGMNRNVVFALLAALLFGASTPFAKLLVGNLPPLLLAGLLYLGSGVGLSVIRLVRDRGWQGSGLPEGQWPWLLGAIFFGGVAAPVALMFGLTSTTGSTASLLLNLEAVLTAVIAWVVFREHTGPRIVMGMAAIVTGGVALSWPSGANDSKDWIGPALVGVACLCWAIDNNLTRKVAAADAIFVAASKGIVAGAVNSALALSLGASLPPGWMTLGAMAVGLFGYGVSLVLFILALRGLGTARTGAYFSIAPFAGAALAVIVFGDAMGLAFWLAASLMAIGVCLHLTEAHAHEHFHQPMAHQHAHVHDEHHQHAHDFAWNESGTHQHAHKHTFSRHRHAHFPDIHHRHRH